MKTPLLLTALRHSLLPLLLALALPGQAQTPQLMTYQGYLTDGNGNVLGGTNGAKLYDVVFRLWDIPSGGTIGSADELYAEIQTVSVNNGYFSLLLGQGNQYNAEPHTATLSALFATNAATRYIEITVRGIGVSGADVTLLPRLQLVSAPYAFMAANANTIVNAANGATLLSGTPGGTGVTVNGAVQATGLSVSGPIILNGTITNTGPTVMGSALATTLTVSGPANVGTLTATNLTVNGPANVGTLTATNLTVNGPVNVGTLTATGAVTAASFAGSGGGLTNIPSTALVAIPLGMVLIPAGPFMMGDSLDGESDAIPAVSVTVSGFYMDVNLVSASEWLAVYYWAINNGYSFAFAEGAAPNQPVQGAENWYDCVKWCNARSEMGGLTPCYYTNASLSPAAIYRSGTFDLANNCVNWAANGYRLPTEAEWEKAARGGLTGYRFPWGNTITENLANYYSPTPTVSYDLGPAGNNQFGAVKGGTGINTTPAGFFAPNGYGLYDMAGNVFAWCWDWYAAPPYPAGSPYLGGTDPHGPASGTSRVLRGGSYANLPNWEKCASRGLNSASTVETLFGLRCVKGF